MSASRRDTTGTAVTACALPADGHMRPVTIAMSRLTAGIATDIPVMTASFAAMTGTEITGTMIEAVQAAPGETGTADGTDSKQAICMTQGSRPNLHTRPVPFFVILILMKFFKAMGTGCMV